MGNTTKKIPQVEEAEETLKGREDVNWRSDFVLCKSREGNTQCIIHGHGSWEAHTKSNKKISPPDGVEYLFYTPHNTSEVGGALLVELLKNVPKEYVERTMKSNPNRGTKETSKCNNYELSINEAQIGLGINSWKMNKQDSPDKDVAFIIVHKTYLEDVWKELRSMGYTTLHHCACRSEPLPVTADGINYRPTQDQSILCDGCYKIIPENAVQHNGKKYHSECLKNNYVV